MQAALMKRNSSKVFPATPELSRSASLELIRSNSGLVITPITKTQRKVLAVIESKAVTTAIICATLFALCGADVWVLSEPSPKYDVALYSVSLIVFLALLLEFALLSRFKPRYAWSLFSFLDFLAVISLIPDVLMLFDADPMSEMLHEGNNLTAQAARALTATTHALRMVRVIKLTHLVQRILTVEEEDSRIGGKFTQGVTQNILILVMLVMIATGLLELLGTEHSVDYSISIATLEALYAACRNGTVGDAGKGCFPTRTDCRDDVPSSDPTCHFNLYFRSFVASQNGDSAGECNFKDFETQDEWEACRLGRFDEEYDFEAYEFKGRCEDQVVRQVRLMGEDVFCSAAAASNLRSNPIEQVKKCGYDGCSRSSRESFVVVESVVFARSKAMVNFIQTGTIMVLLGVTTWLIERDANRFVMNPLRKLARLVERLSSSPLDPINHFPTGQSETDVVERALKKFGRLLQIGFGEAGSEIIGKNLGAHGDLNPMIKGKKMRAIFSFGVVRNFTGVTECLQEDVMVFVNSIAHILHRAVQTNLGRPNKNIGESFLNVWRLADEPSGFASSPSRRNLTADAAAPSSSSLRNLMMRGEGGSRRNLQPEGASPPLRTMSPSNMSPSRRLNRPAPTPAVPEAVTADSALRSCISAIIEIDGSPELLRMAEHPKIQERLQGFRVEMGFGLHAGWAIEGAIGSVLKIDASYLSPNVNVASRLQSGTVQFQVDILMSDVFHRMLSPAVQGLCRRIDRVKMKGSTEPLSLYTFDVPDVAVIEGEELTLEAFYARYRPKLSESFRRRFNAGVDLYLQGHWLESKAVIEKCLHERQGDGPCTVLIQVMKEHNFYAPANWEGVRELTSK